MRRAIAGAVSAAVFGALIGTLLFHIANQPAERCRFVGDREIVTSHCIPYCPPDPKECE